MRKIISIIALSLCLPPSFLNAQTTGSIDEGIFRNFAFRSIGPAIMGGRIDRFAVVENKTKIIYAGTASGGVFKTVNNGVTWDPVFDNEGVSSVGDIAVSQSDPNIVWVGTGEPNNRQSSSWGDGVYKSTDAGKTWANVGLKDTRHIGRLVIDPKDANTVYVGAAGHLWGPNKERGVFKTTDGGKTWKNALFINEDTGCIDLVMDAHDNQTLYAAAYERRRTAFGFNGGGPHSGIYKTTDGGANWTKLAGGLPASGDIGRIGLAIAHNNSKIVFATIESAASGLFKSEDGGQTWTKISDANPRPTYFSKVQVDPSNDQRLFVGGGQLLISEDGGKTFASNVVTRIHGDFHAIWIDPNDADHMLLGSDGGIAVSWDRAKTWDFINTIPLGQFYEIGFDMRNPYFIYGGTQDNGTWGGPSRTYSQIGIVNDDWFRVAGGVGFYTQVDPTDPNTIYYASAGGNISRFDLKTGEAKVIRPVPEQGAPAFRFNWNSPILISPHDRNTIYLGGNELFISKDRGNTWRETADLSKQIDRDKLPILGKPVDKDTLSRNEGQASYGQITTVAESPIKPGLLWAGTDDGNVQVSRDSGTTWKNLTNRITGVPQNTYVSRIVASNFNEGTAYLTYDGHRSDDYNPYVYVTNDFGETWKSLASTLPAGQSIHVIREHPRNQNLLFIGTEFGLFISLDKGAHWMRFKANLPTMPVDDVQIHPRENDLILGTHGRSIWVLDDITPLEQMSEKMADSAVTLFDLRTATNYRIANNKAFTGHKYFSAPNPPTGAIINYYLKERPEEKVKITILDKDGKTIRTLDGTAQKGFNRIAWDLRGDAPARQGSGDRPRVGGGDGEGGGRAPQAQGTRVAPGDYQVKITVGTFEATKSVKVIEDPRL